MTLADFVADFLTGDQLISPCQVLNLWTQYLIPSSRSITITFLIFAIPDPILAIVNGELMITRRRFISRFGIEF